jgi:hypothetical protein
MTIVDKLIYANTNKTIKKAIQKILSDKLPQNTISKFLKEIWTTYEQRSNKLGKKETFGATIMVKLSLLTLLIYEKLIAENIERQQAIEFTSEITWIIYEKLTDRFWIFTRLFSKKPIKRVTKAMNFFIKYFPYKSPGYEMEILKTKDNEMAFNVYKCPAAEFFKEHQLSELCTKSWCDLDYPLAEKWNVKLERDKTMAKGNELCDFKFLAKNEGSY